MKTTIVNIADIEISNAFARSIPSTQKIQKYRKAYCFIKMGFACAAYGTAQIKPIILNRNMQIVDGYIQYLVLKENGETEAECLITNFTNHDTLTKYLYIYGNHVQNENSKTYVWRIPMNYEWDKFVRNLKIGDIIFCNTKYGKDLIEVTQIKRLKKAPITNYIKGVANKCIIRNGTKLYCN